MSSNDTLDRTIDLLAKKAKHIVVDENEAKYPDHAHCCQCGDEAHGWNPDTRTWWCDRCAAAWDHKKLASWFQENFLDEIGEGSLADNVIRLLAQHENVPEPPKKEKGLTTTRGDTLDTGDKVVFKESDHRVVVVYTVFDVCGSEVKLTHPKFGYVTSWVDKEKLIPWN